MKKRNHYKNTDWGANEFAPFESTSYFGGGGDFYSQYAPKSDLKRDAEFYQIQESLESFYGLFSALVSAGVPEFDDSIPTACVEFDFFSDTIRFKFNPDFWDELNFEDRRFIVCHEMLHIVLNHGARMKYAVMAKDSAGGISEETRQMANIAADLVVNHMLVNSFGFERSNLSIEKSMVWVDTVFKKEVADTLFTNKSFDWWFAYLNQNKKNIQPGFNPRPDMTIAEIIKALKEGRVIFVDDHDGYKNAEDFANSLSDKILEQAGTNREELTDIMKKLAGDLPNPGGKGRPGEPLIPGNIQRVLNFKKVMRRKWETIITKWSLGAIGEKLEEQWTHDNRRNLLLAKTGLMLPSDDEKEFQKKEKIDVFFFLDGSGSCYHYADRFFKAAASLNPKKFKVRLFCRTTKVTELDPKVAVIKDSGGSDDFRCMENFIQGELKSGKIKKYPSAVFHITDGYDCSDVKVCPQHPERWHWFLSPGGTESWVSTGSKIYKLEDFE